MGSLRTVSVAQVEDILDLAQVQAIVIPVNTQGKVVSTIAQHAASRWPKVIGAWQEACGRKKYTAGDIMCSPISDDPTAGRQPAPPSTDPSPSRAGVEGKGKMGEVKSSWKEIGSQPASGPGGKRQPSWVLLLPCTTDADTKSSTLLWLMAVQNMVPLLKRFGIRSLAIPVFPDSHRGIRQEDVLGIINRLLGPVPGLAVELYIPESPKD